MIMCLGLFLMCVHTRIGWMDLNGQFCYDMALQVCMLQGPHAPRNQRIDDPINATRSAVRLQLLRANVPLQNLRVPKLLDCIKSPCILYCNIALLGYVCTAAVKQIIE